MCSYCCMEQEQGSKRNVTKSCFSYGKTAANSYFDGIILLGTTICSADSGTVEKVLLGRTGTVLYFKTGLSQFHYR